jgi:hypothetical protein
LYLQRWTGFIFLIAGIVKGAFLHFLRADDVRRQSEPDGDTDEH